MPYRTILVYFSGEDDRDALISAATQIGAANSAHVIGVYIVPPVQITPAVGIHIPPEILDRQRDSHRDLAKEIEGKFTDAMKREGLLNEWRTLEANGPSVSTLGAQHARMCDLVIASQPDYDDGTPDQQALPADLLLECGRPVLLIPRAGKFPKIGGRIFLSWNGEREAARAAFDALPFLEAADHVRVHWVNPEGEYKGTQAVPGSELAATLARHGVKTEAGHSVCDGMSVGDEILSRLADYGSDLLVMGGYGHSRFREMVFGGATRHILRHMTVPVLMSH